MVKKFKLNGQQVFESQGIPLSIIAKRLFQAMADIADQVEDNCYIEIEDKKIGYIELHFYEKE